MASQRWAEVLVLLAAKILGYKSSIAVSSGLSVQNLAVAVTFGK